MFMLEHCCACVMGGVSDMPLLTCSDMIVNEKWKMVASLSLVSHTAKTTSQLECPSKEQDIEFIELDANLVSDEERFANEVDRCLAPLRNILSLGRQFAVILQDH